MLTQRDVITLAQLRNKGFYIVAESNFIVIIWYGRLRGILFVTYNLIREIKFIVGNIAVYYTSFSLYCRIMTI